MYVAVLRVSGKAFDPDRFVEQHGFTPDVVWHAGELGPGGRVRPESGFNLTIADAPTPREIVPELRLWVRSEEAALRALGESGVRPVIDVGLAVGIDPTLVASVTLEVSDLSSLAALGVAFRVSAYAASGE